MMARLGAWCSSHKIESACLALCLALIGVNFYRSGFILSDLAFFQWVAPVLLALSIRTPRVWLRGVLVDFLPFILVIIVYETARGIADNGNSAVHHQPQLEFDRWLTAGHPPTVWLQQHLLGSSLRWYDYIVFAVYVSHFIVFWVVAAALWRANRSEFQHFTIGFMILTMAGFITYLAYPAAPPWMAATDGLLPPVERLTSVVLGQLAGSSGSLVSSPDTSNGLVNNVAAIPSMHAAWCFYVCLFLWQRTRRWRWVLVAYPLAMGFTLVYGGEHYVFDILLGWVYATAAFVAMNWIVKLWRQRAESSEDSPGPVEEHGSRSVLVR
jgi:hypothetical protein